MKNDWINFLAATIDLDGITVEVSDRLAGSYPNKCYVVDGDSQTVRIAEND